MQRRAFLKGLLATAAMPVLAGAVVHVVEHDIYGRSPMLEALPDLRSLIAANGWRVHTLTYANWDLAPDRFSGFTPAWADEPST